jgi:hypothetical protein
VTTRIKRLVERDRQLVVRVSTRELERCHRAALAAGVTLSEFVRDATRAAARELERELAGSPAVAPP